MASGVLQFTLGLTTGGFVSALGGADSKLKGFLGGMVGLGAISAGVWKQMEKGVALKKLADQSGESAGSIFKLQKGLKAVGADADSAGMLLFQMQKALGGVNEQGEPTAFVLSQLGLSIEQLRTKKGAEVLDLLASKIGKLDRASATSAASKIFGRFSAREFLQVARNSDEFARAIGKAGTQAAIFDRYSDTFFRLQRGMDRAKEKVNGIFLGIAAGVAPALENVVRMLDGIDLSQLGADIGTFLTAVTQAFREGKLAELIGDSLKVGFEAILAFAPAIFEKLGYMLIRVFETPLTYLQAGLEYVIDQAINNSKVRKVLAIGTSGASEGIMRGLGFGAIGQQSSFADIYKERKAEGLTFNLGSGEFGLGDINADANKRMDDAKAGFREKWKDYWGEVTGLATRAKAGKAPAGAAGTPETLGAGYTAGRTALEKMGFVMGGGFGGDPARDTAKNTAKMVGLLEKLVAYKPLAGAPAVQNV